MRCCSKVRSTASGGVAGGSEGDQPQQYVCLPRRTVFADFRLICQFSSRVRAHAGVGKTPLPAVVGVTRRPIPHPWQWQPHLLERLEPIVGLMVGRRSTGTGAAFHQELWQTSIYLFKSQPISLLFIFAGDPVYRCRCCLARAIASGDGRS